MWPIMTISSGLVFGVVILFSMTVMSWLHLNVAMFSRGGVRASGGASVALLSDTLLDSYTNTFDFIEASVEGVYGIAGYYLAVSLGALLLVWAANLATSGGSQLVR